MARSYNEHVLLHINDYQKIKIPALKIKRIKEFVTAVIDAKKTEEHYKKDKHNAWKRFYTGTLGEAAIEEVLKREFIDWTVGDSALYNEADLRPLGYNVGIKTVDYGNFPVIHKQVKRPEIINIRQGDDTVYVCGLATIDTLLNHQDDELIKSPALRSRGTKTGFYGFDELKSIKNIINLKYHLWLQDREAYEKSLKELSTPTGTKLWDDLSGKEK